MLTQSVITEWHFHAFFSHARTANGNASVGWLVGPGLGLRFSSCRETIPADIISAWNVRPSLDSLANEDKEGLLCHSALLVVLLASSFPSYNRSSKALVCLYSTGGIIGTFFVAESVGVANYKLRPNDLQPILPLSPR